MCLASIFFASNAFCKLRLFFVLTSISLFDFCLRLAHLLSNLVYCVYQGFLALCLLASVFSIYYFVLMFLWLTLVKHHLTYVSHYTKIVVFIYYYQNISSLYITFSDKKKKKKAILPY